MVRGYVKFGWVMLSGILTGCVGYDGGSEGASMQAQALGLTQAEEAMIRGAVMQKALSADEIARLEKDLDRWDSLPADWKTQASLTESAKAFKSAGDYESCAGDINCASLHCAQVNICVPEASLKQEGSASGYAFDCRSSRVTAASGTSKCAAIQRADRNGTQDQGETDVDCGGPNSPYACPIGKNCSNDADCIIGACVASTGTGTKTCTLARPKLVDVGRFWPTTAALPTGAPYPEGVAVPSERTKAAQVDAVSRTPALRDQNASAVAAENTFTFQHDTCVAHLLAQGCSPLAVEFRTKAESYELMICPIKDLNGYGPNATVYGKNTTSRDGVGISTREKQSNWETIRRASTLRDDPFLCNHAFTRGTRVLSHESWKNNAQTRETVVISDERTDGGTIEDTTLWTGPTITRNKNLFTIRQDKFFDGVREWGKQLEYFLLGGAACSAQRVRVGGITKSSFTARTGFSQANFCARFAPYTVPGASSSASSSAAFIPFTADEWAFVKANVPWWNDYDIYSIDPEGNPNMPANVNMQYGWDAMHPGLNFGSYAGSWGTQLTLTSSTYSFNGSSQRVWGQNGAAFAYTVR